MRLFLTVQGSRYLDDASVPDIQIILKSAQLPDSLRNLAADHVNKLIKVSIFDRELLSWIILCNLLFHHLGPWYRNQVL